MITHPIVLVLEGLPFPEDHVDFTVYVDAAEADIEQWFVDRFLALCAEARTDDTSFFRSVRRLLRRPGRPRSPARCGTRSTR